MKKLSIVTVTYNDLENLKATVGSVMCEIRNDTEYEYIIIDGASTDGTADYLKTIKLKDIEIVSETDQGIYNAMNKGISKANGEWVLFLNAGDILLPGVLKKLRFRLDDNVDSIYGDIFIALLYEGKQYYKLERADDRIDIRVLRKHMQCSHQAFLCRRQTLINMHGFDEGFKTAADWDLIIRLALGSATFEHINTPIVAYDKTGVSSKPHPIEKHKIRKKNKLYKIIDVQYIKDLIQAICWYIIAMILGEKKRKYQIKYRHYSEQMVYEESGS